MAYYQAFVIPACPVVYTRWLFDAWYRHGNFSSGAQNDADWVFYAPWNNPTITAYYRSAKTPEASGNGAFAAVLVGGVWQQALGQQINDAGLWRS